MKTINEILESVDFIKVDLSKLKYNHKDKLSYWLDTSKFRLYHNKISVDDYIAFQQDGKQFYAFSMCRESNSDNYISSLDVSPYYLTKEKTRAILEVLDILTN